MSSTRPKLKATTTVVWPAHAKYSASASPKWGGCAGALTLEAGGKQYLDSSRYAAEGSLAHRLGATCLTGNVLAQTFVGNPYNEDGMAFVVDQAFADHLQTYVDNIRQYADGGTLLVEKQVDYSPRLGVKPVEGFGTTDAGILYPNEMGVHDLKFGQGEVVEAVDNWQLMLYALGLYTDYGDLMGYDESTKVTMVIHQPRIRSAPSEWSCTVADLLVFAEKMTLAVHLERAALFGHAAYRNNGCRPEDLKEWAAKYLVPGESQCRWCRAKPTCPAVRAVVTQTVFNHVPADADEFKTLTFVPKTHVQATGDDWLSAAMTQVPLIKEWIKAVTIEIDRRVLNGGKIEGFKVVMGDLGDRAWSSEDAAEKELKSMRLKQEDMYVRKLISPTGAEKLTKGKDPLIGDRQWKKLSELIKRAPGAPRVVPSSHRAPAIVVAAVDEEFDDLSNSLADDIG